jgi:hypothetical protein
VYLAVGVLAWIPSELTGHYRAIELFFRYPGTLLQVGLAGVATWFSGLVAGEFSPGEPLRLAWRLITFSAACDLFSQFTVHVLSQALIAHLFDQRVMESNGPGALLQQVGVLAGGTARFALLAIALWRVLRIYRLSGLLAPLQWLDGLALAAMAVYLGLESRETVLAMRAGMRPPPGMILGWPTDPLLYVLLAQALLLYRSARQMRPGLVGKCWQAMACGMMLVALGDFLLWATRSSYLPWPWSAVEWYVWLPASAAFAVAPIYQLQAIYAARDSRRPGNLLSA